jgi:hypothetical protein
MKRGFNGHFINLSLTELILLINDYLAVIVGNGILKQKGKFHCMGLPGVQ